MKKIIAIAALTLSVGAHSAIQPFTGQRTLNCGDVYELSNNLKNDYGETPMMKFDRANSEGQVKIIIFVNPEKGTTTIVEAIRDGSSCIITEGENMGILQRKGTGKGL
jgi:hypothetical protein